MPILRSVFPYKMSPQNRKPSNSFQVRSCSVFKYCEIDPSTISSGKMTLKMNAIFVFAFCMQGFVSTLAKPILGGCGCDGLELGGGLGGGFGGGLPFGGGFGGFPIGDGYGSFPISAPSPPISFLPVPQPVPIRIPQPPKQSVTIPNIILALLPPNQKPPCPPRPIIRPPSPVIVPLPQPYPLPYPGGCGC